MMLTRRFLWLLYSLMVLGSLALAFQAYQEFSRTSVIVEWKTASELDTAGFNLYRSENRDGPFIKVNSELIPASNEPLTGGSYRFEDKDILPGRVYYYQLEDIELGGLTTKLGITEVEAKRGGQTEFFVSILLAVVGLIGLGMMVNKRKASALSPPALN